MRSPVVGKVLLKGLHSVFNLVQRARAHGLSHDPEFKILGAIVVPLAITMVDIFAGQELPAKDALHYVPMLRLILGYSIYGSTAAHVSTVGHSPICPLSGSRWASGADWPTHVSAYHQSLMMCATVPAPTVTGISLAVPLGALPGG